MKDIRINALANMLVKILNIVFPLITTAYLSRVLSKQLYGEFNIANTYLNLFLPFATLGVYNYGIREISKVKNSIDKINKMFSTLFYVSVFCTIVTTIFFIVIMPIYTRNPSIQLLILILGIQLIGQIFFIEWMNEAFENYKFLFYKTLIIRIGMLISIFTFVKKADDIIPYAFIIALSQLLNYLISFFWIKKDVKFVKVPLKDYKPLIKPLIGLFLLANAGMLYTTLDMTFVSKIGKPSQVSYYANGQRIVMLISGVISGAISVSVPRLSYYIGLKDLKSYRDLILKSSQLFSFFIVPIGIGIMVLGVQGTVLMYGSRYAAGGIVTQVFGFRTITWALEIILGTQVILINGYEHKLTEFYLIGGAINIILNSGLYLLNIADPQYYVFTTMLAEYVLLIIEYRFIQKLNLLDLKIIFRYFIKYTLIALGFVPITWIISMVIPFTMVINKMFILNMIVTMVICGLYYAAVLLAIKDNIFMNMIKKVVR